MRYGFELTETLERKLKKLQTKNKVLLLACRKKIFEEKKLVLFLDIEHHDEAYKR